MEALSPWASAAEDPSGPFQVQFLAEDPGLRELRLPVLFLGFRVLGFKVQGLGFRVQGLQFRV